MEQDIISKLKETQGYIRKRTALVPRLGIILGSGIGNIIEPSGKDVVFFYNELPNFASSTVEGHAGRLVLGAWEGANACVMQGRLHYYEGYSMDEITYPVRLLKLLGVETIIITAAAGALAPGMKAGDIVVIKDHINCMGASPLRGRHYPDFGERFCDMSGVYDKVMRKRCLAICRRQRLSAREGVYAAVAGPSYETPAESAMLRGFGADVVGMSVVPEAVAARQMGMNVLGLCYVANVAARRVSKPLSHAEVLSVGLKVQQKMAKLISTIMPVL